MRTFVFAIAAALAIPACASGPKSTSEQHTLDNQVTTTLDEMRAKDPGINQVLGSAYAYAVFPDVGKGGFIVGAAGGRGMLYEQGRATGNVKIQQGSFGAQAGAQTFAELVVLHDQAEVNKLKSGHFDLGGNASAVVIKTGGGLATETARGQTVFVMPRGGAMVDVSVAGQRIMFEPLAG